LKKRGKLVSFIVGKGGVEAVGLRVLGKERPASSTKGKGGGSMS